MTAPRTALTQQARGLRVRVGAGWLRFALGCALQASLAALWRETVNLLFLFFSAPSILTSDSVLAARASFGSVLLDLLH